MEDFKTTRILQDLVVKAIQHLYGQEIQANLVQVNVPKKDFDADYTVVIFPFVKMLKKNPVELGKEIGYELNEKSDFIESFEVASGFLNLTLANHTWHLALKEITLNDRFGQRDSNGKKIMIEYASPNTNKPIHLGHMRNILLGHSCSKIHHAAGYEVIKTQIINDRGIAVCKSMYAWQNYADGATPETAGLSGDRFVGDYYVLFDSIVAEEYTQWQETPTASAIFEEGNTDNLSTEDFYKKYKNTYFNKHSKIGKETKAMLLNWEAGDENTIALWKKLNDWVYDGWWKTFKKMGVDFTKNYYESDTYKLGKSVVESGLQSGLFYKKEDGSVWVDLEDAGMDKKIIIRSDGTAVYITQDLGTAIQRYKDFGVDSMVYVVGDEQEYHFKVLFEILKRLGEPYADKMYHLSYGMVDLPTGKMKSREGTVVDADDLMEEVIQEATDAANERGGLEDATEEEKAGIFTKIGLAALKFQLIKVQPRKRMVFDPKESVDMQGQTGPYIQNAYVRIQSILRKFVDVKLVENYSDYSMEKDEKNILRTLLSYPDIILQAAKDFDPSIVANYSYSLAKQYHKFYHDYSLINAESKEAQSFRIALSVQIARILEEAMDLLGIEMPERM